MINAENAAHRSEKFATMATRTRQEYLKDLVSNYTTNIVVETNQKFCKSALLFMIYNIMIQVQFWLKSLELLIFFFTWKFYFFLWFL